MEVHKFIDSSFRKIIYIVTLSNHAEFHKRYEKISDPTFTNNFSHNKNTVSVFVYDRA